MTELSFQLEKGSETDLIDVHRPSDVLQRSRSDVAQGQAELADDRLPRWRGNADSTGLGWER
jgi:hypothetical protein